MRLIERLQNRLLGYRSTRNFATHTPGTVALSHDSGFFSNCSVLLMSLARSDNHPVEIDVSESFTHFAERKGSFQWSEYFLPPPPALPGSPARWPSSRVAKRLPHHSVYKLLDFSTTTSIKDTYFRLSDEVRTRAQEIENLHLPSPINEVLVVCLRGTDKGTEVRQSPLRAYVRRAKKLMARHKNVKVWVQTDQAQIRDALLDHLGPRSFSLDILPVTEESQVIHRSQEVTSKADFSRDLLATTWLLSQAHSVITYTGNVGYWITIFRGNARRLHQLR